jgi:hypothetical protein
MEYSFVQLMDLSNEILIIIFKKLSNHELLYSLNNINMRLDQIISDPIFTNDISLIKYNSLSNRSSALPDIVLDRFCFQILPEICHKIKCFTLETSSIERILLAAEYCNLHQLTIYCMNEEIDMQLFTGKIFDLNIVIIKYYRIISIKSDSIEKKTEYLNYDLTKRSHFFTSDRAMFTL